MRVGILGGGQLSLMLAQAALRLKLKPIVFAQSSDEPAPKAHFDTILGSINNAAALEQFFSQTDLVVFENEFVNCQTLLHASTSHSVTFRPGLETLTRIQDKLEQKKIFQQLGIKSPMHLELQLGLQTRKSLQSALQTFGSCILKWSHMGYDGKGVMLLEDTRSHLAQAVDFCNKAQALGSAVYAEEFVDFKRELAIIGVLSTQGAFATYPVVISEQENNMCSRVFGPAREFGLGENLEREAQGYAENVARTLKLYGSFAIEMFETHDGRLLANEIAPRVHNSGHYTQDACITDQFENHWRAVLGMPLGETRAQAIFAMLNFLGPQDSTGVHPTSAATVLPSNGPRSRVHWYGKSELRPQRKMGHINGVANNPNDLQNLLEELNTSKIRWSKDIEAKNDRCTESP